MQVITYIKDLKVSPKKLRFLLAGIKKMKPQQALSVLSYTPKKGAKIYFKAISSAIASAKSILKINENLLKFKLLTIEEGMRQKRWRPGGRGTAKMFKRRSAHIKIILEAEKQNKEIVGNETKEILKSEDKVDPAGKLKTLAKGQSSFERKNKKIK